MKAMTTGGVKVVIESNAPDVMQPQESQKHTRQGGEEPIHSE